MRSEFHALRRIARLASAYLENAETNAGTSSVLDELRAALTELERRFPYTLETTRSLEVWYPPELQRAPGR
jgi:hypothetical protein